MSADLLRRAAVKLREHAEAATPGPWGAGNGGQVVSYLQQKSVGVMSYRFHIADCDTMSREDMDDDGLLRNSEPDDDADYIALLHPPVALALADAMDDRADECGNETSCVCWEANTAGGSLARVASAILREEGR